MPLTNEEVEIFEIRTDEQHDPLGDGMVVVVEDPVIDALFAERDAGITTEEEFQEKLHQHTAQLIAEEALQSADNEEVASIAWELKVGNITLEEFGKRLKERSEKQVAETTEDFKTQAVKESVAFVGEAPDIADKDIVELRTLHDKAENVRHNPDLSPQEAIKIYENFLVRYDALAKGLITYWETDDPEASELDIDNPYKAYIDRRIGIPPMIFGDSGADYVGLLIDQRKKQFFEKLDEARNLNIADFETYSGYLDAKKNLLVGKDLSIGAKDVLNKQLSPYFYISSQEVQIRVGYSSEDLETEIKQIEEEMGEGDASPQAPENAEPPQSSEQSEEVPSDDAKTTPTPLPISNLQATRTTIPARKTSFSPS